MTLPYLTKKIHFALLIVVSLLLSASSYCQRTDTLEAQWKDFNAKLETVSENRSAWLDSIDKLVMKMPDIGKLKEKLAVYKKIVWSSGKESWRRQQYWWYLALHARLLNQNGLVIFYIEKRQQELGKKDAHIHVSLEKIALLSSAHNAEKTVEEYKNVLSYVTSMPQMIDTGDKGPTAYSLLMIMQEVIKNYAVLKDTHNINKLVKDAAAIYLAIERKKDNKAYAEVVGLANQINIFIQYYSDVFFGKMSTAEQTLKNLLLLNAVPQPATEAANTYLKYDILEETVKFYLLAGKPDSAATYLLLAQRQSDVIGIMIESKIRLLVYDAEISGQKKEFKKAYEKMIQAHAMSDSFIDSRQIEISENMYAQASAEFTQEKLAAVTRQKNDITIAGLSIGIVLLLIIGTLFFIIQAKAIKAKAVLESLNSATQLQVAELEERNRMLVLAEKKKLGMELHDDLAGTLASVRMQLATEAMETTNDRLQTKLQSLGDLVGKAYESTRAKSHEWFRTATEETESAFSERIYAIMNTVLPDSLYEKTISIDDYALKKIELPVKIQLLRIVQESVANILKHAKAQKVSVLIYEDISGIILTISDDGKGFDAQLEHKGRGIGMLTIRDRVRELKGHINIISGKKGTEIKVMIPI
ncbi:MAG: ATP-binding protein [Bacteroidota bacterium]